MKKTRTPEPELPMACTKLARLYIYDREWLLDVGGLSTDRYEDVAADLRALVWNQLRLAALGPAVRPGDYRVATHVSEIKIAHERLQRLRVLVEVATEA